MLGAVTRDPAWDVLADRCWHTVTASGLPRRLRFSRAAAGADSSYAVTWPDQVPAAPAPAADGPRGRAASRGGPTGEAGPEGGGGGS